MPITILNFTHAYEPMTFLHDTSCRWIDCTRLHGTACYCDTDGEAQLRRLLAPYPPEGIHLIDSGDYHYVTKLWTDKIDHPFSLIVFDHHPDMQPPLFESLLSCGCWVRTVLDTNPHVQKVCIVGATEKLKQETQDKVENIYPGHHVIPISTEYYDKYIACGHKLLKDSTGSVVEHGTFGDFYRFHDADISLTFVESTRK